MKQVVTKDAPAPLGPYSQGIIHNGVVQVAMQLGVRVDGTHQSDLDICDQLRQCLNNVSAILDAAGSSLEACTKITIFSTDLSAGAQVNEIYEREFFPHAIKPARTVIGVDTLPLGYKIAVEAMGCV